MSRILIARPYADPLFQEHTSEGYTVRRVPILIAFTSPIAAAQRPSPTRQSYQWAYVAIVGLVCAACANPPALSARDVSAVEATLASYRDAWLANDRERVLSTISDDIVLFVPGPTSRNVVGRDSIDAFWFPRSGQKFVLRKYEITDQEIHGSGDLAVVQGKSALAWDTVVADSIVTSSTSASEFLSVMRREDGGWRIFRQMYVLR